MSTDTDSTTTAQTDPPYQASGQVVAGSTDAATDGGSTATMGSDPSAFAADSGGGVPAGAGVTDLVNLGLAVWKVMDDGTPNMVPTDRMGSGVPAGVNSLSQMSDFSSDDRQLQMRYTGSTIGSDYLPGFDPTDLTITVLWRYGGRYQGAGHYVAQANVPSPASRERGATSISRRRLTIPSTSALRPIRSPISGSISRSATRVSSTRIRSSRTSAVRSRATVPEGSQRSSSRYSIETLFPSDTLTFVGEPSER